MLYQILSIFISIFMFLFCRKSLVLAAPAVKMDKNKDFLHKSWFATFSRDRLEYHAFGNTQATDFFYNLDLGEDLDVLMIGSGERVTYFVNFRLIHIICRGQ